MLDVHILAVPAVGCPSVQLGGIRQASAERWAWCHSRIGERLFFTCEMVLALLLLLQACPWSAKT